MSFFDIITDEQAEQHALDVFNDIDDKFGTIPVFYRLLATAPPLVETYWLNYNKVIQEGALPGVVKELIFLAIARKLKCRYCSSAHLAICDIFEIDRTALTSIMELSIDFQPTRTAALLEFCLVSLDNPSNITDQQYKHLYEAGINDIEIMEALYTVSFANAGIYMAKMMKVDIDHEVAQYLSQNELSIGFI